MASVDMLQQLFNTPILVMHFEEVFSCEEAIAEEKFREAEASVQAEHERGSIVSDSVEIMVEVEKPTEITVVTNEPANNEVSQAGAVEEITVQAGENVVAKEKVSDATTDDSAAIAKRQARIASLRTSVVPVIERGDYLEMGRLRKTLLHFGLQDEADDISAAFIHLNRRQAQALCDVRDKLLARLEEALAAQNVSRVRNILEQQVASMTTRLNDGLKPHVKAQLEILEERSIEEIRRSFDERIEEAFAYLATRELKAQEEAEHRQQQIEAALLGDVCPKAAERVRTLVSQVQANMCTKNFGAIRSALVKLSQPENFLGSIAHFGSVPKFHSFIAEVESATRTAEAKKRQQKKGGKRQRQFA